MPEYPVRAGVFNSAPDALKLIERLRAADFTWKEISVICSDETKQKLLPNPPQEETSNEHAETALNAAGVGVLGLGGLAAMTALLTTAGTAVVIMGAFAGLAAAGTFASLMASRGFDSEASDYYDQAVQEGKILVAVEVPGSDAVSEQRRNLAAKLISQAGADPVPLAH